MELKNFITQALVDIRQGVKEANCELGDKCYSMYRGSKASDNSGINFDVAVTVGSTGKAAGSGKAYLHVVSLGANLEKSTSEERLSRIKFTVHIDGNHS